MKDISAAKVQAQLERIIASPKFVAGRKLGHFLEFVVRQTLNGRAERITQYTIAMEALGYGEAFDPTTAPNVRAMARRLRRALGHYYASQGTADPIRIEIPKGGYVPVFRENQSESPAADSNHCPIPDPEITTLNASKPTIAVMMIDCLNEKEKFGHFATGLTEEILIALTKFPQFLVVGPLSKARCHWQGLDTCGIGQEYGVRFVLHGTLRLMGDDLRLTIRLSDTKTGGQLWGHTLDHRMQNGSMLFFYDDIVNQVVGIIADNHGIIPLTMASDSMAKPIASQDAYEAVLKYYHYFRVLSEESFINAMNALEDTVRHYPDHALAMAALGDLIATTYLFGYDEDPSNIQRAEALGRKSVAIDPSCQIARFTMALVHFLKFQKNRFIEEAKLALKLNPHNANYLAATALHIGMVGNWDHARELVNKAMRLNPHHPGWYHIIAFMESYLQGQYENALIEARRFNSPDFFWDPLIRAAVLGQLDRPMEANKAVGELQALIPDFENRGPGLIRRLAYLDDHVNMLVDGLRKAGLEI